MNALRAGIIAAWLAAALTAGCGPSRKTGPLPAWAENRSPSQDQDYFYGAGCAQYQISNKFFKKRTARERARIALAESLEYHLVLALEGDTAAARAVIEQALPHREKIDSAMDEQGNYCVRVRLKKNLVDRLAAQQKPR